MAKQCLKPKSKRDATWFRDKVLLVEAQGSGKVLNEEELEILAEPRVVEGPVTQTVITHNAAYQGDDLDTYDSDCDDFSIAKAILMANLSSYGRVNTAAQVSNAITIALGIHKIDPVSLAPKDKNIRETHIYYLKHTIEQAAILSEIVEQAKSLDPLDSASYFTCKLQGIYAKGLLVVVKDLLLLMRIEQYFFMTDYSLWEVILNGGSPIPTRVIDDAKTLMEAIEKRFGRNKETKKVQKTLLKQQYKKFTGSSSESLDQIHDRLQKLISQLEILRESLSQEYINLKFLRSIPTEWRTHTLIWRNKTDLEDQSLDDLFNSLKIYEAKVKSSSTTSSTTQNIAFVSSQNTDSTNESVSAVASVFAASAKVPVYALPNVDTLNDDDLEEMDLKWQMEMLTMRARRFLYRTGRNLGANGTTSIGFDMLKVECYNCHRRGHFARECRSPKDTRRNVPVETQRTNVPVETSMSNALVSYQSGEGYHVVPPPYTGTFMPPKPDLVFHDAFTVTETVSAAFNVELSPTKPDKDLSQSNRLTARIIEDWVFDLEDDSKCEPMTAQKAPSFVPTSKHVKTSRPSVKPAEHPILTANLKTDIPKPKGHRNSRNRKACFVCKSLTHLIKDCDYCEKKMIQTPAKNHAHRRNHQHYARMTHTNPHRHVVSTAVLTRSKLVPLTAAQPVTTTVPHNNVTRPRPANTGNPQHALKDKGVIDSGCSRHMTGNMSYLTDFEEINGGYVDFYGNTKGGKMTGKGTIRTDTGCIVLALKFKLPDENQVLLRVPRENNIYNVNLKNIVPSGDLTCLFPKETLDKSNLWHKRLGHINFKTMNKLVKDPLGKFDGKADEGFLVGYSVSSKAFRVFNSRIRIVQETLHIDFIENQPIVTGSGPTWLFDIDTLTKSMNYQPAIAGNQPNPRAYVQEHFDTDKADEGNVQQYVLFPLWSFSSKDPQNTNDDATFKVKKPEFEFHVSPSSSPKTKKHDDKTKSEAKGKSPVELLTGFRNLSEEFEDFSYNSINEVNAASTPVPDVGPIPTTRVHKDHHVTQIIGSMTRMVKDQEPKRVHQALKDPSWIEAMQDELLQFKMQKVWVLMDLPIGHTQEEGIHYEEVFAPVAGKEAIRLFLAYASFMGFMVYQTDVKSAFLYGTIKEEVYVCQPLGFEGLDYPDKVYKVVKALYGLHQAPRAWYETLANYLLQNGFQRGKIDQTLFIKKQKVNERQVSDESIGELAFFLGLKLKKKQDGIFISHDKYVAKILKKFGLTDRKSASTPIDTEKPLLKDPDGEDMDVHTYWSMIGSLMYLTSSRPDIMFLVCACAHFQVTPKALHLHAVKRIFRYLMGKPHLGLWYPKDSPFNLVAYSDSDYASTSLDRKSTTRGCQFLGCRLISWQCKKQIVVATSSTEAEYVAVASCYAQVLWIQNQLLDYGNVDSSSKFYMYPRFLQLMIAAQVVVASVPVDDDADVVANDVATDDVADVVEQDMIAQALEITKLKQKVKRLEKRNKLKVSWVEKIEEGGIIELLDADKDVTLEEVAAEVNATKDAEVDKNADDDEPKPAELKEVIEMVTTAKLMTEVVTAATTPITTAINTATPSAARRRKRVVIRDLEETATPSTIVHSEPKSMDKGKGILVEEPKPLKKQAQLEQDKAYARELEAKLNKNINWDDVIEQVKRKGKEDNAILRYQALKRKPQTEAQARKNMMNSKEELEEEGSRALKRKTECSEEKAAKKQKLDEEVEVLKKHLQIVPNDEDDVYTKATPLALKIVRERFASSKPKNFSDDFLLTTLKSMFEKPDVEAQMILLVERRYPMTRFTLDQMLNNVRLEVEEESEVSLELLRFIRRQQQEEYRPDFGIDAVEDYKEYTLKDYYYWLKTYCCWYKLMLLDNAADSRLRLLEQSAAAVQIVSAIQIVKTVSIRVTTVMYNNSFMFVAKRKLCFLEFVSDMNTSSKSKSVKKAKKKEDWKPTGKWFTKIGYNWRPTRRTFTLVRNVCPLTRITATNKVLVREPIPLEVVAQESMVTKVYTRRPKMIDYALWEVIENGTALPITQSMGSVTTVMPITYVEDKAKRRLEVKTRITLMIGIPNEHQLKFNSIQDAKQLMEAIEKRFDRNVNNAQAVNTTSGVSTVGTQVNTANIDNLSRKLTVNGNETIGFDKSNVECYNCHKRGHFARECRAPRHQDDKQKESTRRNVPVETTTSKALVSCDGLGGYDWSDQAKERPNYALIAYTSTSSNSKVSNDSTCTKSCLETIKILKSQNEQLTKDLKKLELMVLGYKSKLKLVEERLKFLKTNESVYVEDIKLLKVEIQMKDIAITELRRKLYLAQKEKDNIQLTIDKLEFASKSLNKLIDCQIVDNCKKGLGYENLTCLLQD
uniref:CCHC-type domain-containing protein n=1 Tax=Tanacetum cinerariifolium TaxID=118510 RepID=A0A6L2KUF2_TANCI|nr:hypothetical protein [Tanacetum cinerariifolium]